MGFDPTNWQVSSMNDVGEGNSPGIACQIEPSLRLSQAGKGLGRLAMGKAIEEGSEVVPTKQVRPRDWRKAMSDNVATALIVYTGLQIFMTVDALKQGVSSTLPYFALIILVAAIIPACRWAEGRWKDLSDEEAADEGLKPAFRRDQIILWVLAIGLPLVLTAIAKAFFALAS